MRLLCFGRAISYSFAKKSVQVYRYSLLTLLLTVSILSAFGQSNRYKVTAIGFYNVENFFDTTDDPNKKDEDFTPNGPYHNTWEVYTQKLHNIASVIEKMGTDLTPDGVAILGLAELENDVVLKGLITQPELAKRNYRYVWYPTPDERGISTAMIYNPGYFKVLSSHPVHVPLETLGMTRPTRDILYVCGSLAGDTVHVLVNHWPSKSGGAKVSEPGRMLAASVCRKIVDSLEAATGNAKVVIMGDLNDDPMSRPVQKELVVSEEKDHLKGSQLYNPWIKLHKQGLGSENYRGEWHLIDQVMLSAALVNDPNDKWKYYNAQIFNKDFLKYQFGTNKGLPHRSYTIAQVWDNGYSDHFPVLVYLIERSESQ